MREELLETSTLHRSQAGTQPRNKKYISSAPEMLLADGEYKTEASLALM